MIRLIILWLNLGISVGRNYSASEANRLRIMRLYRDRLLIRPTVANLNQTIVAVGLGIIEVAGIDPKTQVCLF